MTLSTRATALFAAAALLALGGPSAVASVASPQPATASDEAFRPGMDGVDFAAVTGPKGSAPGKVPACADPARRGDLRPC
jgi:hypothetical protein